jgi:hypothetical protein
MLSPITTNQDILIIECVVIHKYCLNYFPKQPYNTLALLVLFVHSKEEKMSLQEMKKLLQVTWI